MCIRDRVAAQYAKCEFDPESFDAEKTPTPVLIRCYSKLKWEAIDFLLDNQRLMRRFDYFGKKWRLVKLENRELQVQIESVTTGLLNARKKLREEKLDYGALLVALKLEYHTLTSRAELHTKFGTEGQSFLTPEEIFKESQLAQRSNSSQEQDLARMTAVEMLQVQRQGQVEQKGASRRLLSDQNVQSLDAPIDDAEQELSLNNDNLPPGSRAAHYQEVFRNDTQKAVEAQAVADEALADWTQAKQAVESLSQSIKSGKDIAEVVAEQARAAASESLVALNAAASQLEAAELATVELEKKTQAAQNVCKTAQDELKESPTDEELIAAKTEACRAASDLESESKSKAVAVQNLIAKVDQAKAKSRADAAVVASVAAPNPQASPSPAAATAAVAARESAKTLKAAHAQLVAAQQAAAGLPAQAAAAQSNCTDASEAFEKSPEDDELGAKKKRACDQADQLASEAKEASLAVEQIQAKVQQAEAQSEADTAAATNAAAADQQQLKQEDAAVKAAKADADLASKQLFALKAEESKLSVGLEAAEAALKEAESAKDCTSTECVAELNAKREALTKAKTAMARHLEVKAEREHALAEAQAAVGNAETKKALVMKKLVDSTEEESVQEAAVQGSQRRADKASEELTAVLGGFKTLMQQVQGAKLEMESARLDHASRGSANSKEVFEHATAEYNRLVMLAQADKPKLVDAQERKARDIAELAAAKKTAEAATKMRQRLQGRASPPKRQNGPEPGTAAALRAQAEAEATAAAVAKARAAHAAVAAEASQERAKKAAAKAAAFAKAEAQAEAEANEERRRRREMMALADPSKMNPIILQAKMNSLVKEHVALGEANKMLDGRDREIEQQYTAEKHRYESSMHKYTGLTMEFDEVNLKLKAEVRKTTALKPAVGGEGVCMSCPVELP
eukprot:TRINITY_DN8149_c0_g1_i2.p1 TRINITY_DN8149_c0_g1~~TRINITY_DN8149_c0_g1_i2.p1  ORF type:complete len:916 (-),score=335.90 TRINITY_DN8149_c0_g1_i2:165-2912(-)